MLSSHIDVGYIYDTGVYKIMKNYLFICQIQIPLPRKTAI